MDIFHFSSLNSYQLRCYINHEFNLLRHTLSMKIFDTNYGPDIFGRIRMGFITEMFLTFEGYSKPEKGDQLRISCLFRGVVQDVHDVFIVDVADCDEEEFTVLIRISSPSAIKKPSKNEALFSPEHQPQALGSFTLH